MQIKDNIEDYEKGFLKQKNIFKNYTLKPFSYHQMK